MNLLDCSIPYFITMPKVLSLRPIALKTALDLHRGFRYTIADRMRHELGPLAEPVTPDGNTFMLPSGLDFQSLSYAAQKTLIGCYQQSKYSRTPFRIVRTREELAEAAHLSVRHLRKALTELQRQRLVHIKQLWRQGIQISLLDPSGSGASLFDIALFNVQRFDRIPAYEWYRILLHDDSIPRETQQEWSNVESSYVLQNCPFCGARKKFRITLILNENKIGYAKDFWYCHECKRGGDTKRLWGLLHYRIDRDDWKHSLRATESTPAKAQKEEANEHN